MYLLDTNIFLEIMLRREKSEAAKYLFITSGVQRVTNTPTFRLGMK